MNRLKNPNLSSDACLFLPKRGEVGGATVEVTVIQYEALLHIKCANFGDQGTMNPVRHPKLLTFWKDYKEKNMG